MWKVSEKENEKIRLHKFSFLVLILSSSYSFDVYSSSSSSKIAVPESLSWNHENLKVGKLERLTGFLFEILKLGLSLMTGNLLLQCCVAARFLSNNNGKFLFCFLLG